MNKMRWRSRWPRRSVMVAVVAVAAATAPAVASAATSSAGATQAEAAAGVRASGPRVPALHWRTCAGAFQCASARVPLDYRQPRGKTIRIAVMRHRATGPGRRLGSMFFSQGGPADQLDTFPQAYQQIPAAVRARYDVVSFDPRGFGFSTAISCFPTQATEDHFLSRLPVFPVGHRQQQAFERITARFDALCARRNGALLAHDSSADVARDMNLLRAAVGDPVLNYYGESYGTGLGAIYANLFPARTGRMIFDGNIDPAAWSRNRRLPGSLRERADVSDAQTMAAFLRLCGRASTKACAFSAGTPARTTAKWNELLRRLLRHPAAAGSPLRVWTYADVVAEFPEYQFSGWPVDAAFLQQLWVSSAPGHQIPPGTPPLQPLAGVRLEQIFANVCSDIPSPRNLSAYVQAARVATARSGAFGPLFAWQYEPCARWPRDAATDHYAGPWNRPTASTILVVGITTDPATPYRDSVAMARDLARARLLTVDGFGHTVVGNPSACAVRSEVRYLLTGALPPAGTVCRQDATPFGGARAGTATTARRHT
jgi:pimeloyl-ACP methyl ester carboxylesterase